MHVLLALLLQAAPSAPQPDLQEIVRRMYERVDRDAARQVRGAVSKRTKTEEDISNPDRPRTLHRETYRVWGDGTRMMQQKMLRDGRKTAEPPKPLSFFVDRVFLDRFTFVLAEPKRIRCGNGRVCWYLAFMPKPGQTERIAGMEQRFLAVASGTMQVDAEHFGILRVDVRAGDMPYDSVFVDVFWFAAAVSQTELDGTMVLADIDMSYAYYTLLTGTETKRLRYAFTEVKLPAVQPPSP